MAKPETIIMTIKLLNLHVPRARPAPPPNIREGGLVNPVGRPELWCWDSRCGRSPKMVPIHPKPSAEASEIKFHGWVPGDTNSSSMCLWLEEEIRFD